MMYALPRKVTIMEVVLAGIAGILSGKEEIVHQTLLAQPDPACPVCKTDIYVAKVATKELWSCGSCGSRFVKGGIVDGRSGSSQYNPVNPVHSLTSGTSGVSEPVRYAGPAPYCHKFDQAA